MILLVYEVYQTVKKLFLLADKVDPRQGGSLHSFHICSGSDTVVFILTMCAVLIYSYLESLNRKLAILNYHQWFKGFVTEWLRIALTKAKTKIYNAIAVDQVNKQPSISSKVGQFCISSSFLAYFFLLHL